MTVSNLRTTAAALLVLSLAAVGVAIQPAGAPAARPAQPESRQPASKQPEPGPAPRREPGAEGRRGEGLGLGGSMKLMDRSLEKLRGQIGDAAKKDENLRLINEVQRGAVTAKGQSLPPDVLKKAPDEAAKAKLHETFRRELIAFVRKLLDIETEIAEGKTDAARTHLDEAMKMGNAAHQALGLGEE